MAAEIQQIRDRVIELKEIVQQLEPLMSRNLILRALDAVNESLVKYERESVEPTFEYPPHPTPTCILHGKPITWEDPECEICKALKEGNYDGKIGAHDNFRDDSGGRRTS